MIAERPLQVGYQALAIDVVFGRANRERGATGR